MVLDRLILILTFLIAALLITGGGSYSWPHVKLELSQVDSFAWALLALLALRRLRFGTWLPPRLERMTKAIHGALVKHPFRAFGIAIGAYVVLQTWNSIWRYNSFHANAFDLGFVDQALWWTAHGKFLYSTMSKGNTYLGEHFTPLFAIGSLPYFVSNSVCGLFLFQSLVLGSSAALVYTLARQKKIEPAMAALVAICYLAYQPLRLANGFDFREDNLFIPVFLGSLLALEREKWGWFWFLSLLSWGIKENAEIFTTLLGLWIALRRDRPRRHEGWLLAGLSMLAFYVVNTKITPHFAGDASQTMAVKRLRGMGNTSGEILRFIFTHPLAFAAQATKPLLQVKSLKYFLNVATPFIVFVPAGPWAALIVLLGILMNLVVNLPTIGFHYECILIPFLFYILVSGLAQLQKKRGYNPARVTAFLILGFLLFFGRSPIESIRRMMPSPQDRFVLAELAKIPPQASVSAQPAILPHLLHRETALLLSTPCMTEYVVADFDPNLDRYASLNLEEVVRTIDLKKYKKIIDRDYLRIFRSYLF